MKSSFALKIAILITAFAAVVFFMSQLKHRGLGSGTTLLLGLPGATGPNTVTTTLDWCDTRVHALSRPQKPTIHQEKLKWIEDQAPPVEMDFISLEKWFGRNCRVRVERVSQAEFPPAGAQAAMVVAFIKGPEETLWLSPKGLFKWRQEVFRSPELLQALSDLDTLPRRSSH